MYAVRQPLSVEDTPKGRVPYTYHVSYGTDGPAGGDFCCANGRIGPLDVLPAGGTLRSPYYRFMREHLNLPVDHLYEIVDPRRPTEPLLLDLSGSLLVMGAHREDEAEAEDNKRVVLLRGVTQAGAIVQSKPKRETLTLGWVDKEFPYYWGTTNRMVLLTHRKRQIVLPDKTRLTVPLREFLNACKWTPSAQAKAQFYRDEFVAGRVPSFADAEAMVRFPPSNQPGVYGVYTPVEGVGRLVALSTTDPMREEFQTGFGLPPAIVSKAPTKEPSPKAREVPPTADVSRVHNVRFSGADMSRVEARWHPETLEPHDRLLQVSNPVWQDKNDCRPWNELEDEMDELLRLRRDSYGRDTAQPSADVLHRREVVDRALTERRNLYRKRAHDAQKRGGGIKRRQPMAVSASSSAAGTVKKRVRSSPVVEVGAPRRTTPRVVTTSTVVDASTVPDESVATRSSASGGIVSGLGEVGSSSAVGLAEQQLRGSSGLVDAVELAAVALQRVAEFLRAQSSRDT